MLILLRAVELLSIKHGHLPDPFPRGLQDCEEFSHSAFLRLDRTLCLWASVDGIAPRSEAS